MYRPDVDLLPPVPANRDVGLIPDTIALDPFASDDCLDEFSPDQLELTTIEDIYTMNTGEDEPSSGLNGRLRPRKSNVPSPQTNKYIRKTETKIPQDRPKRTSTPSKGSKNFVNDDLATKSELSIAPQLLCPYCDRKFASKQTLSKHIRRIHLSSSKQDTFIGCLFCNHVEPDSYDIIRHMVESHATEYFACLDCYMRFPSATEMVEHKPNVCEKQKLPYRSKLRQKTPSGSKKSQKLFDNDDKKFRSETKEYHDAHRFNGVVISCELKPSQVNDEADIEDNITTNLILPPSKNLGTNAVIEKNAVIVLDDIQWNKRMPANFSFHNTDADQILSRLGVVHRSPRTGESTKKDWFKNIDDSTQKFEKCFDTSFYSKVASNVQENLSKFLDGSFNFHPETNITIKTRKSKNSVVINAAEGFPILLAFEQYSRNTFDGYMPRTIAPKHKWKWENDRNPINPDEIKRDSHVNNCIITLVSSLDIWTQLCMRRKYESKYNIAPLEKKTEKQNTISRELKEILESREIPTTSQVVKYTSKALPTVDDNTDFPASLGLRPTAPSFDLQPAVLSGEWVRPRCYVCCACGAQTRDSRGLSSHISTQHPNASVQHYEIVGELLLNSDILKHLYVPPNQMCNRTRPLRGFRDCTKCSKSISLEDLHQHMLDCAGDTPAVRRKCRYRPFGVRKRRARLPDNTIRKKIRKDIRRTRQTRQKTHIRSRPKIRTEVGDAETIRKMLADLPAKRHRVVVTPMNTMLRPKGKLDNQRSKLIMKRHPSEMSKNRRRETKPIIPLESGSTNDDNDDKSGQSQDKDDDDNKPLKPRMKRVLTHNKRQQESLKRKVAMNRAKRRAQLSAQRPNSDEMEPNLPAEMAANPNSTDGDPPSIDNDPERIDLNDSPHNPREHSGRGRSNNDDDQRPSGSAPNGKKNNSFPPPVQNTPLKHSIARLTAETEHYDSSIAYHNMLYMEQEGNEFNQHVPTGHEQLFENEAVVMKFDKPPLEYHPSGMIDPYAFHKSKLNKPRKGLNDCIAMLKNKLVDPIPSANSLHAAQCENDDTLENESTSMNPRSISAEYHTMTTKPAEVFSRHQLIQDRLLEYQNDNLLMAANFTDIPLYLPRQNNPFEISPRESRGQQKNARLPKQKQNASQKRDTTRRRSTRTEKGQQQKKFDLPPHIELIPRMSTENYPVNASTSLQVTPVPSRRNSTRSTTPKKSTKNRSSDIYVQRASPRKSIGEYLPETISSRTLEITAQYQHQLQAQIQAQLNHQLQASQMSLQTTPQLQMQQQSQAQLQLQQSQAQFQLQQQSQAQLQLHQQSQAQLQLHQQSQAQIQLQQQSQAQLQLQQSQAQLQLQQQSQAEHQFIQQSQVQLQMQQQVQAELQIQQQSQALLQMQQQAQVELQIQQHSQALLQIQHHTQTQPQLPYPPAQSQVKHQSQGKVQHRQIKSPQQVQSQHQSPPQVQVQRPVQGQRQSPTNTQIHHSLQLQPQLQPQSPAKVQVQSPKERAVHSQPCAYSQPPPQHVKQSDTYIQPQVTKQTHQKNYTDKNYITNNIINVLSDRESAKQVPIDMYSPRELDNIASSFALMPANIDQNCLDTTPLDLTVSSVEIPKLNTSYDMSDGYDSYETLDLSNKSSDQQEEDVDNEDINDIVVDLRIKNTNDKSQSDLEMSDEIDKVDGDTDLSQDVPTDLSIKRKSTNDVIIDYEQPDIDYIQDLTNPKKVQGKQQPVNDAAGAITPTLSPPPAHKSSHANKETCTIDDVPADLSGKGTTQNRTKSLNDSQEIILQKVKENTLNQVVITERDALPQATIPDQDKLAPEVKPRDTTKAQQSLIVQKVQTRFDVQKIYNAQNDKLKDIAKNIQNPAKSSESYAVQGVLANKTTTTTPETCMVIEPKVEVVEKSQETIVNNTQIAPVPENHERKDFQENEIPNEEENLSLKEELQLLASPIFHKEINVKDNQLQKGKKSTKTRTNKDAHVVKEKPKGRHADKPKGTKSTKKASKECNRQEKPLDDNIYQPSATSDVSQTKTLKEKQEAPRRVQTTTCTMTRLSDPVEPIQTSTKNILESVDCFPITAEKSSFPLSTLGGSLPLYSMSNAMPPMNKYESTTPVYTLAEPCLSIPKTEPNVPPLVETDKDIPNTSTAYTAPVYTSTDTTVPTSASYPPLPEKEAPIYPESEDSSPLQYDLEIKYVSTVTLPVGVTATVTSIVETRPVITPPNKQLEVDAETAKKIAMLPKELVEILGTMPVDHRNQLLNVLPHYVSKSPTMTVQQKDTSLHSTRPYNTESVENNREVKPFSRSQGTNEPDVIDLDKYCTTVSTDLQLDPKRVIDLTEDDVPVIPKTAEGETSSLVVPSETAASEPAAKPIKQKGNDQTASLRAVRIKAPSERKKSPSTETQPSRTQPQEQTKITIQVVVDPENNDEESSDFARTFAIQQAEISSTQHSRARSKYSLSISPSSTESSGDESKKNNPLPASVNEVPRNQLDIPVCDIPLPKTRLISPLLVSGDKNSNGYNVGHVQNHVMDEQMPKPLSHISQNDANTKEPLLCLTEKEAENNKSTEALNDVPTEPDIAIPKTQEILDQDDSEDDISLATIVKQKQREQKRSKKMHQRNIKNLNGRKKRKDKKIKKHKLGKKGRIVMKDASTSDSVTDLEPAIIISKEINISSKTIDNQDESRKLEELRTEVTSESSGNVVEIVEIIKHSKKKGRRGRRSIRALQIEMEAKKEQDVRYETDNNKNNSMTEQNTTDKTEDNTIQSKNQDQTEDKNSSSVVLDISKQKENNDTPTGAVVRLNNLSDEDVSKMDFNIASKLESMKPRKLIEKPNENHNVINLDLDESSYCIRAENTTCLDQDDVTTTSIGPEESNEHNDKEDKASTENSFSSFDKWKKEKKHIHPRKTKAVCLLSTNEEELVQDIGNKDSNVTPLRRSRRGKSLFVESTVTESENVDNVEITAEQKTPLTKKQLIFSKLLLDEVNDKPAAHSTPIKESLGTAAKKSPVETSDVISYEKPNEYLDNKVKDIQSKTSIYDTKQLTKSVESSELEKTKCADKIQGYEYYSKEDISMTSVQAVKILTHSDETKKLFENSIINKSAQVHDNTVEKCTGNRRKITQLRANKSSRIEESVQLPEISNGTDCIQVDDHYDNKTMFIGNEISERRSMMSLDKDCILQKPKVNEYVPEDDHLVAKTTDNQEILSPYVAKRINVSDETNKRVESSTIVRESFLTERTTHKKILQSIKKSLESTSSPLENNICNDNVQVEDYSVEKTKGTKRRISPHGIKKSKKKKSIESYKVLETEPEILSTTSYSHSDGDSLKTVDKISLGDKTPDIALAEKSDINTSPKNNLEKQISSTEKRKNNNKILFELSESPQPKKYKFAPEDSQDSFDIQKVDNYRNYMSNKFFHKAETITSCGSSETRTACYNVPVPAKRGRSKSVGVKSSTSNIYDPYDIDLEDMIEHNESFRRKPKVDLNISNSYKKDKYNSASTTKSAKTKHYDKTSHKTAEVNNSDNGITNLEQGLGSDSDESSKSDEPLQKYVEEKEKKIMEKESLSSQEKNTVIRTEENTKNQIKVFKKTVPTARFDEAARMEAEEELRSEQFMESFGFFSERKPRKSNLLATKKISETIHITNESDDMYFGFKSKKDTYCEVKKQCHLDASKQLQPSTSKKAAKRGRKKKSCSKSLPSYCPVCKKEFRRPDNYLRHQITLLHISKLSEVEMKVKTAPVHEEPNYLIAYKQYLERFKKLTDRLAKKKKKNAKRAAKIVLPTMEEILSDVNRSVREQQLSQRGLSNDEALFLDCCELLKESHKGEPAKTDANKSSMSGLDLLEKALDDDSAEEYESDDGDVDSITAQNILESEEVKNLENDLISGLKEAANATRQCNNIDYRHSADKLSLGQSDDLNEPFSSPNMTDSHYDQMEDFEIPEKPRSSKNKRTDHKVFETIPIKEKMYPDVIEDIDMFEDKFDKIKRKCRSQAAAAKQTPPVVDPNKSQKAKRRSEKKKGKKNSKKTRHQSTQVPTKGALKGFDGIKVSIPTSDINMPEILPVSDCTPKKKNKTSSKKKRDKRDSESSSKYDSDHRNKDTSTNHTKKLDVYEFMDNEDAELFEFRPSTLMERFKSINNKDGPSTSKANPVVEENSRESASDGDDFVYMSDDYVCSDDETENSILSCEMGNAKAGGEVKKNPSPPKRKDVVEKNAVMGKIFKHNAVRAEKKNPVVKEIVKPKANLDQLFDSLLVAEPGSSVPAKGKPVPQKDDEITANKNAQSSKHEASTSQPIPSSSHAIPSSYDAIPSTSHAIPSTSRAIPSTSHAIPSTSHTTTSTSHPTPSTSKVYDDHTFDDDKFTSPRSYKSSPGKNETVTSSSLLKRQTSSTKHDSSSAKKYEMPDYGPSTSRKYEHQSYIDYGPSTSKKYDNLLPKEYKASSPKRYDSVLLKKTDGTSSKYNEIKSQKQGTSSTSKQDDEVFIQCGDYPKSPTRKIDEGTSSSYDIGTGLYEQSSFDDEAGVARQRARRKCTVGKQNVLAETWSSESEPDGAPPRPDSAESDISGSSRKKKGRKKDGQQAGGRRGNNRQVMFKKQDVESRVSSNSRNTSGGSSSGGAGLSVDDPGEGTSAGPCGSASACSSASASAEPVPSTSAQAAAAEAEAAAAAAMPAPSTSQTPPGPAGPKGRKSVAYYWSSEGDDEQEHQQQHGWIVGDSHKKLVTMLAHAKGRKRNNDDKRHSVE